MKAIVVLQLAVLVTTAIAFEYTEEWEMWKTKHGKIYKDDSEELHRRTVWASNKVFVEEHNKNSDKHGFTVEMNKFADLVCMLKHGCANVNLCFILLLSLPGSDRVC